MSRAVAIGDERRLAGYALAGAEVRHAVTPEQAIAAWAELAGEAALLVLTPEAHDALAGRLGERDDLVWVVVPT
jgi:vacuolar-type H+-ATPase subunit F/Vma7